MTKRLLTTAAIALLTACGSATTDADEADTDGPGGKADDADAVESAVCLQQATHPNTIVAAALADIPGAVDQSGTPIIANYTAWPVYDPSASSARIDADVVRRIADPDEARANLASRYGDCSDDVEEHLEAAKPNVYIYFSGFGGADQNNSLIGQAAVLRWINHRDPNALIFSINWNCADSQDPFCSSNTDALAATDASPQVQSMNRAIDVIVPQIASSEVAEQLKGSIAGFGQQQRGYDSAHSHSMSLAAKLIDQLLVADQGPDGESLIGDIHIAGYSMGAHSAAQLLVQDFTGDGGGFEWSANGCADGGNQCAVAELDKVKWSLAMGLSGWAHAIRTHNGLDGGSPRTREEQAQYENGGLFRVSGDAYQGKLAVLNRRMDPTGSSDDTFQRGFLDIFFGDYNHYSHDYSLPLFIDESFKRVLDAFLESGSMQGVQELGIMTDNASRVTFDECEDDACDALTGYAAHEVNRSHAVLDIPRVSVKTVDGVKHPEMPNNRAATLPAGSDPIVLRTFDQEDLRGGVELYLRPHFAPTDGDVHGIFSYGGCGGSQDELMPQAVFQDGQIVFTMNYEGEAFSASVDAESVGVTQGEWSHLAFTWELPVESLTVPHENQADLAQALPGMIGDLQQHQVALVLATGLTKPLATTYKRQAGEGVLSIFVNGELADQQPLGTDESSRECLSAADVISTESYDVNGETFPPFIPYARYDAQQGDIVAFSPDQILGTKCKAYRVRNEQVFFGCGGADSVDADADMDDITLIWGPGRTAYEDIDHETGEPVTWPIGVEYGPEPLEL